MKIISCCKAVPEEQDITIKANGDISLDRAKLTISNFDLNSIEAGAQIVETAGGELVALSAGAASSRRLQAEEKYFIPRAGEPVYGGR